MKSAWLSKINWTQVVSVIAMIFAFFGIDIPDELKTEIIALIGVGTNVVTIIIRTWFTTKLTNASVKWTG